MTSSQTYNKQKQVKEYCSDKGVSVGWPANVGVSENYIVALKYSRPLLLRIPTAHGIHKARVCHVSLYIKRAGLVT